MNKEYCEFCFGAKALVIGKTNDIGIATKINYCSMCGRRLMNRK